MNHVGYLIVAGILTSSLQIGACSINTCSCAVEILPYRYRQRRSRENPIPHNDDGFPYDDNQRRLRGVPDVPDNSRPVQGRTARLLPARSRGTNGPQSIKVRPAQVFPEGSRKEISTDTMQDRITSRSEYQNARGWERRNSVRPVWFKEDNEYQYGLSSYVESLARKKRRFQDPCRCSPTGNTSETITKLSTRKPTRARPATMPASRKSASATKLMRPASARNTTRRMTSSSSETSSAAVSVTWSIPNTTNPTTAAPSAMTLATWASRTTVPPSKAPQKLRAPAKAAIIGLRPSPASAFRDSVTSKSRRVSSPGTPSLSTARKSSTPLAAVATKTKDTATEPTTAASSAITTAGRQTNNASPSRAPVAPAINPRQMLTAPVTTGKPPLTIPWSAGRAKPGGSIAPATAAVQKSTSTKPSTVMSSSVVTSRNPSPTKQPRITLAIASTSERSALSKATNGKAITTVPGFNAPSPRSTTTSVPVYARLPSAAHLIAASPTWGSLPTNLIAMGLPALGYYQPADTSSKPACLTFPSSTSTNPVIAAVPAVTATSSSAWTNTFDFTSQFEARLDQTDEHGSIRHNRYLEANVQPADSCILTHSGIDQWGS